MECFYCFAKYTNARSVSVRLPVTMSMRGVHFLLMRNLTTITSISVKRNCANKPDSPREHRMLCQMQTRIVAAESAFGRKFQLWF